MPQLVRGVEDFFQNGFRTALQMDNFATPIVRRPAPFHPAIFLEPVEQAGESRSFNPHAPGNFLLREFVSALREMDQRPPFALAQAERAQALVELGAPGPSGAEKHLAEFV